MPETGGGSGLRLDHAPYALRLWCRSRTRANLCASPPAKKERKRNADRRTLHEAASADAAAREASRARLSAFHHGTCGSDRTPPLSSSSRTSWDGATEGRMLSVPGRPSAAGDLARRPVIVPAGRFGPEPPECGADNPARGNRLAPVRRRHPAASLRARITGYVTVAVTNVKGCRLHMSDYLTCLALVLSTIGECDLR